MTLFETASYVFLPKSVSDILNYDVIEVAGDVMINRLSSLKWASSDVLLAI